jgi:hypothetical protein
MLHIILGNHLFTGVGRAPPFAQEENAESKTPQRKKRQTNQNHQDSYTVQNLGGNYKLIEETTIPFNPALSSYYLEFKQLKHFTYYHVEVKACRAGM